MSGHSHWASIKHKKAAVDAKRGRLWSKLARVLIVAARNGGDPSQNLALRYAIDKAKAANMPRETIEKAVKKGTGELGPINYEEVLYEGYAVGGVAIMVEVLTENRNRTGAEIRKLFERHGGALGTSGCVNWMFHKKGLITVSTSAVGEDELMEIALAEGADDVQTVGDVYEITCAPAQFEQLKNALKQKNIATQVAEVSMVPQTMVPVNDPETAKKVLAMMEGFEENEDVKETYANFDIPEQVLSKVI